MATGAHDDQKNKANEKKAPPTYAPHHLRQKKDFGANKKEDAYRTYIPKARNGALPCTHFAAVKI